MRVLATLHRLGVNTALVAGLVLMPAVIAVGYWADGRARDDLSELALRGSIVDPASPPSQHELR